MGVSPRTTLTGVNAGGAGISLARGVHAQDSFMPLQDTAGRDLSASFTWLG